MATPPDPDSPENRPLQKRSWSERVARARAARPPAIEVSEAVRSALARERAASATPVTAGAPENDPGAWGEFARLFATPRALVSGAVGLCAALPLAWWVFTTAFARLDAFSRFLVLGGLPRWLVAIVT
jgi:hypothetical protein